MNTDQLEEVYEKTSALEEIVMKQSDLIFDTLDKLNRLLQLQESMLEQLKETTNV